MSVNSRSFSESPIKIPLSTAPYPVLTIAATAFYYVLLFTSWQLPQPEEEIYRYSLFLYAFAILLPCLYLIWKKGLLLKRTLPPVIFNSDSLVLPKKLSSSKTVRIPYENIVALAYRGSGKHAFYSIDTKRHTIHLPRASFANEDDWLNIHHVLLERLHSSSHLPEIHDMIQAQESLRVHAEARRPLATILLLLILLFVFTVQHASKTHLFSYLAGVGANSQLLVWEGDWYRLFTAGFLHSGYIHLSINLLGLFVLGYVIERLLGSSRFLLIFVLSVLGGNLCSALGGAVLTVGASSGIFGLFGAFFWLHGAHYRELPSGYRIPMQWWWYIAMVDLLLPVIIPKIDLYAHAGGFTTGFLCALLVVGREPIQTGGISNRSCITFLSLTFVLCCAACIHAFQDLHTAPQRAYANLRVMEHAFHQSASLSLELNHFAWTHAVARAPYKESLELSLQAVNRAVQIDTSRTIRDTRATIQYRLGHFSEALQEEATIYEQAVTLGHKYERSFFGAQLVRFAATAIGHRKTPIYDPTLIEDCKVQLQGTENTLVAEVNDHCPLPLLLYSYGKKENGESVLLRIVSKARRQVFSIPSSSPNSLNLLLVRPFVEGLDSPEVITLDDIVRAYPVYSPPPSLKPLVQDK